VPEVKAIRVGHYSLRSTLRCMQRFLGGWSAIGKSSPQHRIHGEHAQQHVPCTSIPAVIGAAGGMRQISNFGDKGCRGDADWSFPASRLSDRDLRECRPGARGSLPVICGLARRLSALRSTTLKIEFVWKVVNPARTL